MGSKEMQRLPGLPNAIENSVCLKEGSLCSRERVVGEAFCARHLGAAGTEAAALRRCLFISTPSGRRCPNRLPKGAAKEGLCPDHAELVTSIRRRAAKRARFQDTPETIAENLAYYKKFAKDQSRLPKPESLSAIQAQNKTRLHRPRLDYMSDASTDEDESERSIQSSRLNSPPLPPDLDSPNDPLRNAGVFTAEEVVRLSRDKLVRLQARYGDALRLLQHKLRLSSARSRRRIREQHERFGPLLATPPQGYREQRESDAYRALRRYGRTFGRSALARQASVRERKRLSGLPVPREWERPQCQVGRSEEGVEGEEDSSTSAEPPCGESALPSARFCIKHILRQEGQLLFAACEAAECEAPVPPIAAIRHCWLHRPIPTAPIWDPPAAPPHPAAPVLSPEARPVLPSASHKRKHTVTTSSDDANDTINVLSLDCGD